MQAFGLPAGFVKAKRVGFAGRASVNRRRINICLLYTSQAENIGYLFWGGVGTGKSYLAACIANALMEKMCIRDRSTAWHHIHSALQMLHEEMEVLFHEES